MSALTTHLREPGEHGALAFHPACPICRDQRLLGTFEDRPLLSTRTQAALAAGVLAASALGPVPVVIAAGEPPREHEGQVAPEDPASPGDSSQSPDFDPGGPDTELPVPVGPEDPEANPDAPEPLEVEPDTDPGVVPEPLTDPGTAPEITPDPGVQEQPATDVAPPLAPAPAPVSEPPPVPSGDPVQQSPTPPPQREGAEEPSAPDTKKPASRRGGGSLGGSQEERAPRPPSPSDEPTPSVTVATEVVAADAEAAPAPVIAELPAELRAEPGDRVHVVQRGESLWSIAKDVLGSPVSIAEVAREVNRLWELNRERIGTGNPDLILPGTRLRLS